MECLVPSTISLPPGSMAMATDPARTPDVPRSLIGVVVPSPDLMQAACRTTRSGDSNRVHDHDLATHRGGSGGPGFARRSSKRTEDEADPDGTATRTRRDPSRA